MEAGAGRAPAPPARSWPGAPMKEAAVAQAPDTAIAASNAPIAPSSISARSAFFPGLRSRSSGAQSAPDATDAMAVQIGQASAVVAVSARRSSPADGGAVGAASPAS